MFEARQGCAARECAAQGLVKLASTGAAQSSGTLVNPAGNTVRPSSVCCLSACLPACLSGTLVNPAGNTVRPVAFLFFTPKFCGLKTRGFLGANGSGVCACIRRGVPPCACVVAAWGAVRTVTRSALRDRRRAVECAPRKATRRRRRKWRLQ